MTLLHCMCGDALYGRCAQDLRFAEINTLLHCMRCVCGFIVSMNNEPVISYNLI